MGSHTPPDDHSSSQQYCLRWNNYQNNLTNVFDQLLQAEAFVDVTLSAEGHSLKAHKVVLCACSPYFQALFFDNPCKHPIVILNGVKWMQLKALTEFMYRGEINVAHDQLASLLKVAELLKIRGLADVSHSRSNLTAIPNPNMPGSTSTSNPSSAQLNLLNDIVDKRPNPVDFLSNSNHSHSGSDSPSINGHGHSQGHNNGSTSIRRKRRKMSTPERTPSPDDREEDDVSVPEENEGDREGTPGTRDRDHISMTVNPINPATDLQRVQAAIGPALLNLHAAAAAAMAVNSSGAGSSNTSGTSGGGVSSNTDMDIKPGIVEMIREEERAKMLETAHGWLGQGGSGLSESYQYQIQNLWQKCWSQNQGGMMHALRFRERGPLKSWRPETMAEAIFAVLREGLSLSQAARKYDIPYPTFVLYANRVHNMLGPSADGSTSSDLMSDMRPKGRGRPQRILLGSWPEEHIRGVIRAVVFRDTQTKDDIPFVFNRDGGLCMPQPPSSSSSVPPTGASMTSTSSATPTSQNGVDMSLHPMNFGGFGSPSGTPNPSGDNRPNSAASASSSNSSSPLQQALSSISSVQAAAAANMNLNFQSLQAAAQSQLQLAFQQQQQQLQKLKRRGSGDMASLNLLGKSGKGSSSSSSGFSSFPNLASLGFLNPSMKNLEGMKDILQIKSELGMGCYDENENDDLDDEDKPFSPIKATDLSRSSPEKDNSKEGSTSNNGKEGNNEDGRNDLEPVAMVQVQMDQCGPSDKSMASASTTSGIEQTSSPPR